MEGKRNNYETTHWVEKHRVELRKQPIELRKNNLFPFICASLPPIFTNIIFFYPKTFRLDFFSHGISYEKSYPPGN